MGGLLRIDLVKYYSSFERITMMDQLCTEFTTCEPPKCNGQVFLIQHVDIILLADRLWVC